MKKALFSIACVLCFSTLVFSQTKKIAHRSHSGKNKTFSIYGPGNFGLPPEDSSKVKKDSSNVKNDSNRISAKPVIKYKKKKIQKKSSAVVAKK